jgi:hypothetical protein
MQLAANILKLFPYFNTNVNKLTINNTIFMWTYQFRPLEVIFRGSVLKKLDFKLL